MQSLSCYQSSESEGDPDQSPMSCSASPPPSPPQDFTGTSSELLSSITLSLPAVEPISVNGNHDRFLVHVHIPVTHPELRAFTNKLMGLTRLALVGQPIKASFTPVPDPHVSLSLATTIQSQEVHQLLHALRQHICCLSQTTIRIHSSLRSFLSGDKSRVYVAAPVTATTNAKKGNNNPDFLIRLIHAVNAAYASCGLPPHYATPIPHMSFAWTDLLEIESILKDPSDVSLSKQGSICMDAKFVMCSIGKVCHRLKLRAPLLETQ